MKVSHVNFNFGIELEQGEGMVMTNDKGHKFEVRRIGCSSYGLARGVVGMSGPGINKDGSRALVDRSLQSVPISSLDPAVGQVIQGTLERFQASLSGFVGSEA